MMTRLQRLFVLCTVFLAATVSSAAEPKSEFFTASDGAKLHYLTLGDQGSWVVLIHGASDSARRMWFSTGIAESLAKTHRVVAIDCRGHGESREATGGDMAKDVMELMQHLKIEKAHIHGYSMGGGITGRLLASNPEKFITVGFHGSGLPETDAETRTFATALDRVAREKAPPEALNTGRPSARGGQAAPGGQARGARRGPPAAADGQAAAPRGGRGPGATASIDIAKLDMPMIFINGSLDAPYSRASRALREAKTAKLVVLEGKNHFTAIMVGGPMPQEYITELTKFINEHDKQG